MASINTSSGWGVTWIYEQDLTSAYMNSFLYSIIRPGVYNANIYLTSGQADDSKSGKAELLQLCIKKGTTLIFSNDYKKTSNQGYRRNFVGYNKDNNESILKEQIPLLIKCTALKDMYFTIAKNPESSSNNDKSLVKWYNDERAPEALYVIAFLRYNQSEDKDYSLTPTFCLNRNNPIYGQTDYDKDCDSEASKFFFYHTGENYYQYSEGLTDVWYWRLPDGSEHYGGLLDPTKGSEDTGHLDMLPQFSYLTLGVIADNNPWKDTQDKQYTQFNREWLKYHTFTARCLPEYRHSLIGDCNSECPDFIVPMKFDGYSDTTKFSRLYIDFKNIINYGTIYNTSINWESAYEITNNRLFPQLEGTKNTDYITYPIDELELNKVRADNKYWPITSEENDKVVVVDFTFATTRSYYNISEEKEVLPSDLFNKTTKIKLFNHREVLHHASDALIDTLNCGRVHSEYRRPGISNDYQICLDTCELNNFRLVDLITNNDILSKIINKVRRETELDPVNGESLIPVAISFRAFTSVITEFKETPYDPTKPDKNYYIGTAETGYSLVIDPESQTGNLLEQAIYTTAEDGITSIYSVNPINVLSLLDLNYKMNKLSPIESRTQDAYSIVTVIK